MLRAAPKKRFGFWSALASRPPDMIRPERRIDGVVGSRQPRDGIQQDHDVIPVLDQALGFLQHHLGHLDVSLR